LAARAWLQAGAAVICALVAAASARASVAVHIAADPPANDVVISQDQYDTGSVTWKYTANRNDVGQSFLPAADFTLDRVTVLAAGFGSGTMGAPFTLRVYRFTGAGSLSVAEEVSAQSGTMPSAGYTNGVNFYVTFDIADLALEGGKPYGFLLGFDDTSAGRLLVLTTSSPDSPYAGGNCFQSLNGGAFTAGDADLAFYLQQPGPEPATLGLLAAGLLGALALRRRR